MSEQSNETAQTLTYAPLTEFGLLERASKYREFAGSCMQDAARYAAQGDDHLVPIAEEHARRYALVAHEAEQTYQARRDARLSSSPGASS